MKTRGISDAGILRLSKFAGNGVKEVQLISELEKWLDDYRVSYRQFDEDYGFSSNSDPLADVAIWPSEKTKSSIFEADAVALVYEGAGYDDLSYESEMHQIADKNRSQLSTIAKKYGYYMEDYSSWASLFYKD